MLEAAPSHWGEMVLQRDSLEVLVVLMETVEVVGIPWRHREMENVQELVRITKVI